MNDLMAALLHDVNEHSVTFYQAQARALHKLSQTSTVPLSPRMGTVVVQKWEAPRMNGIHDGRLSSNNVDRQ